MCLLEKGKHWSTFLREGFIDLCVGGMLMKPFNPLKLLFSTQRPILLLIFQDDVVVSDCFNPSLLFATVWQLQSLPVPASVFVTETWNFGGFENTVIYNLHKYLQ